MTLPGSVQVSESWNVLYPSLNPQILEDYNVVYDLESGSGGQEQKADQSEYVFVSGVGVTFGKTGDNSLLFHSGDDITDTGDSDYVFESGTGIDTGGSQSDGTDDAEGTVNEPYNVVYPSLSSEIVENYNVVYPVLSLQLTKDWED